MEGLIYEAEQLGVSVEWLTARSAPVGLGRCPQCWPENDIIKDGNYIEPCDAHSGARDSLASTDDQRVRAPVIDIVGALGGSV